MRLTFVLSSRIKQFNSQLRTTCNKDFISQPLLRYSYKIKFRSQRLSRTCVDFQVFLKLGASYAFLLSAGWDAKIMAGGQAAILESEEATHQG